MEIEKKLSSDKHRYQGHQTVAIILPIFKPQKCQIRKMHKTSLPRGGLV
jgi:hypothetical protein